MLSEGGMLSASFRAGRLAFSRVAVFDFLHWGICCCVYSVDSQPPSVCRHHVVLLTGDFVSAELVYMNVSQVECSKKHWCPGGVYAAYLPSCLELTSQILVLSDKLFP